MYCIHNTSVVVVFFFHHFFFIILSKCYDFVNMVCYPSSSLISIQLWCISKSASLLLILISPFCCCFGHMFILLVFYVPFHFIVLVPSHKSVRHEAVRAWLDSMSGGSAKTKAAALSLYLSVYTHAAELSM